MNHGQLSEPMPVAELTLEKIGLLMGGISGEAEAGAA
jgi:simple sugar transport system ATP-binding protein